MTNKTLATMMLSVMGTMSSSMNFLRATEVDEKIDSLFRKTYAYRTYLKDDKVNIVSKDGVVTLTGIVSTEYHKNLANEIVVNLPGVTEVNNKLVTQAEDKSESSDTWISMKVRISLLFHRHVEGSKTIIETKGGVVTLKGDASSMEQKELTTHYAKNIDGVKAVNNEMTVVMAEKPPEQTVGEVIDDISITAQVKTALLLHSSTSMIRTSVKTIQGEVTLSGDAKNEAEKSLVSKLVEDIRGVVSVNNQMTISKKSTE